MNTTSRKKTSRKARFLAPLAVAAGGLAIVLAPTASAAPIAPPAPLPAQHVPGNAQFAARPGPVPVQAGALQYPFWGNALLFHNAPAPHGGPNGGPHGGPR